MLFRSMDALVRLETLAMMGDTTIPIEALRRQISGAVHLVVQTKRYHDGSRKISNITEVLGVTANGTYQVQDIFKFVQKGIAPDGKILGQMEACSVLPTFYEEMIVNNHPMAKAKFVKPGTLATAAAQPARQVAPGNLAAKPASAPAANKIATGTITKPGSGTGTPSGGKVA